MNYRYSLIIQWSEEDQFYLVTLPEFSDIAMQRCTYGKTYEEAFAIAQEAIAGYLDYCQEEGVVPPASTPIAV
jgi:predicted RNase H-like HicB family nuclease